MINTTDLIRELLQRIRLGEDSVYGFKGVIVKSNEIEQPNRDSTADELAAFVRISRHRDRQFHRNVTARFTPS